MIRNLCRVLGHRRNKHVVRPLAGDLITECSRCGTHLVRGAGGKWRAVDRDAWLFERTGAA